MEMEGSVNKDGTITGNFVIGVGTAIGSVGWYDKARDILSDPNYSLEIGPLIINDRVSLALGAMAVSTSLAIYSTKRLSKVVSFFRNINKGSKHNNLGSYAIRSGSGDPKPAPENPDMP